MGFLQTCSLTLPDKCEPEATWQPCHWFVIQSEFTDYYVVSSFFIRKIATPLSQGLNLNVADEAASQILDILFPLPTL